MILVTGGTGFVGSHLLYKLSSMGFNVRATYRKNSSFKQVQDVFSLNESNWESSFKKIQWVEADLMDCTALDNALSDIETVIHCAGFVSFNHTDKNKIIEVNKNTTCHVVNAMLANGVKRIIYVSSIASIGNHAKDESELTENIENMPSKNDSVYAKSKYLAELEIWRGVAEGLEAVIVQPSVIIGYSTPGSPNGLMASLVNKKICRYPTGSNGFVSIDDIAKALVNFSSMETLPNETYILNSENLYYKEFIQLFQNASAYKCPLRSISNSLLRLLYPLELLAATLSGRKSRLNRNMIRILTQKFKVSGAKYQNTYATKYTPIADAVKKTLDLYIKNSNNPTI